ncbi:hypothetical protein Pint_28616 [Pistacia integerrima]|uniref:Uncharacterized protein n=1 Tax=Pistacia integerrima TaxID=434235 RepID=A0ACC0YT82_9ROSI|nr:hypothetical protein Pint_28616 [Pistacia integerrima]
MEADDSHGSSKSNTTETDTSMAVIRRDKPSTRYWTRIPYSLLASGSWSLALCIYLRRLQLLVGDDTVFDGKRLSLLVSYVLFCILNHGSQV